MGALNFVGVFLLLVSWVMFLIASISSPVINDLGLLKVTLTNGTDIRPSSITFGSFGYCVRDVPPNTSSQDWCTGSQIGYQPASVMATAESTDFNRATADSINSLTNGFVLHAVVAVIAFIAFVVALIPTFVTSLLGALIAIVAFIIAIIVMSIDFAVFTIVRDHVNRDGSGSRAYFGETIWLVVAGTIALFFGAIIVFFTCCSTRSKRRHSKYADAPPPATRRAGFFSRFGRRRRY